MDQTLPESVAETRAGIEVYTLILTNMDVVRKYGRPEVAKIALREMERCQDTLDGLARHLKRFGPRDR